MNKTAALILSLTVLAVAAVACTCPDTAPAEAPPERPTQVPTEARSPTPIEEPTPSRGDTRTRSTDGAVMVYVPAGEFQMGSTDEEAEAALELCDEYYGHCQREWFDYEQPAYTLALDGFWIDRTEVTNGQYAQCVTAGACEPPVDSRSDWWRESHYGDSAYDDYPVIWVNWHQAGAYCEWAEARLPTEGEWEYAARGPEGLIFPWGDEMDGTRLNYCDASCEMDWAEASFDDGYADTAPVGSYPDGASWVGALDMAGNVSEWVAIRYEDYPGGLLRGSFPSDEPQVTHGGSCYDSWSRVRTANRDFPRRGVQYTRSLGFRCAASPGD